MADELKIVIKGVDDASSVISKLSNNMRVLSQITQEGAKRASVALRTATISAAGLEKNLAAAAKPAQRLDVNLSALQTVGAGAHGAMSRLAGNLKNLGSAVSGVASKVGTLTAATGALAAGGLTALAIKGSQVSAQFESSSIAFESMLGSAQKANALLNQLVAFAAQTPFELEDVVQGSQRLLAFGFAAEKIIPTFRVLGDAVAALGGGREVLDRVLTAFGQILSKGRVQGEELLQLAEAGIPAYQILQQQLRLTGEQIGRIGELGIDANTAIDALTRGLSQRFGGAMTRLSNTVPVVFSNLKDSITQVFRAIGDVLKPFVLDLLGTLQRVVGELQASGALQTIFKALGQVILNVADSLKTLIRSGQVRQFFANIGQVIGKVLAAFARFASSQNLVNVFGKIADAVKKLAENMNDEMARKLLLIGAALAALPIVLPAISTALSVLTPAVGALFTMLQGGINVVTALAGAFATLGLSIAGAVTAGLALGLVVGTLDALNKKKDAVRRNQARRALNQPDLSDREVDEFMRGMERLPADSPVRREFLTRLGKVRKAEGGDWGPIMRDMMNEITPVIQGMMNSLSSAVNDAMKQAANAMVGNAPLPTRVNVQRHEDTITIKVDSLAPIERVVDGALAR